MVDEWVSSFYAEDSPQVAGGTAVRSSARSRSSAGSSHAISSKDPAPTATGVKAKAKGHGASKVKGASSSCDSAAHVSRRRRVKGSKGPVVSQAVKGGKERETEKVEGGSQSRKSRAIKLIEGFHMPRWWRPPKPKPQSDFKPTPSQRKKAEAKKKVIEATQAGTPIQPLLQKDYAVVVEALQDLLRKAWVELESASAKLRPLFQTSHAIGSLPCAKVTAEIIASYLPPAPSADVPLESKMEGPCSMERRMGRMENMMSNLLSEFKESLLQPDL